MNKREAAKVRHIRTETDIAMTLLNARLRAERRSRNWMATRALWPEPRAQRNLDLLHEANRLVLNLEQRLTDTRDAAAERYWTDVYVGLNQ